MTQQFLEMPDKNGYFGEYGGQIIPPELKTIMDQIDRAYEEVRKTAAFQEELESGKGAPLLS
jgi:tryptophan synthase beta chain